MNTRILKSLLTEEVRYLVRETRLFLLLVVYVVGCTYFMMAINMPAGDSSTLGSFAIAAGLMVPMLLTYPVTREKQWGIFELLLSTPMSPEGLITARALAVAVLGFAPLILGIVLGVIAGSFLGSNLSAVEVLLMIFISALPLFPFALLFTLLSAFVDPKHMDIIRVILFFSAYFGPAYVLKYAGTGIPLWGSLLLSTAVSLVSLMISLAVIKGLGRDGLSERMVLI